MTIDALDGAAIPTGARRIDRRPATPTGGRRRRRRRSASALASVAARRSSRPSAEANSAVASMLDSTGDVHDAMIALQRAELTLQLTVQIRNKLVQAYQDIMRMPI